jgi:drug/metabolite transporter (DMT)-like permease
MDSTRLYIAFPFIAMVFWGLLYATNGRVYQTISVPTNVFVLGASYMVAAFIIGLIYKTPIDLAPYITSPDRFWLWFAPLCAMVAIAALHLGIKYVSSSYAALAEIGYVVLTPVFAYLLFNQKHLNGTMMIGAVIILIGTAFVIFGQLQMQKGAAHAGL